MPLPTSNLLPPFKVVYNFDYLSVNAHLGVGSELYLNWLGHERYRKECSEFDSRIPKLLATFGVTSRNVLGLMLPRNTNRCWNAYKYNFLLNIPGYSSQVLYQFKPYAPRTSFFRWSLVPSHFDQAGLEKIADWHYLILGDYCFKDFFRNGKSSRADFAIDFVGLDCDHLFFITTNAHSSKVYINPVTGQRETVIVGSRHSPFSYQIYNKTVQLSNCGLPNLYHDFHNVPRFEVRTKLSCSDNIRFRNLSGVSFKLDRTQFYYIPPDKLPTTRTQRKLIELIRANGLARVLYHTDSASRQIVLDHIAQYRIYPFDIWDAQRNYSKKVQTKLHALGYRDSYPELEHLGELGLGVSQGAIDWNGLGCPPDPSGWR